MDAIDKALQAKAELTIEIVQSGPDDFEVEIEVGDGPFTAGQWERCTDRHDGVTGDGSINGLVAAAKHIKRCQSVMAHGQRIWAVAGDETRVRAYCRLLRYGFSQASEFGFNSDGSQWRGEGRVFVFNA